MIELSSQLITKLIEKEYTITTVESCTGGLLAGQILDVAGASACFKEGYITYSNESKQKLVGVEPATLQTYGAVSKETAIEMCIGAALVGSADVSISTTGIAGPGGGSLEKPVGLVYIACYIRGEVIVSQLHLTGDRRKIRQDAVCKAIELSVKALETL